MSYFSQRLLKNSKAGDWISLAMNDRTKEKNGFYPNMTNNGDHWSVCHYDSPTRCNYISLNTFTKAARTSDNVSNLNGFLLDFDDPAEISGELNSIEDLVARAIVAFGYPTWLNHTTPSKGKVQMVFLFKEPEDRVELWESVSYSITCWAKSDEKCYDIARVFRVPGSVNGKNGEKGLFSKNDAEYSLDYFIEKCKELDIEIIKPKVKKSTGKEKLPANIKMDINEKSVHYSEFAECLNKKPSESEARMSFVAKLIRQRKNDSQIKSACASLNFDPNDVQRIFNVLGRGKSQTF